MAYATEIILSHLVFLPPVIYLKLSVRYVQYVTTALSTSPFQRSRMIERGKIAPKNRLHELIKTESIATEIKTKKPKKLKLKVEVTELPFHPATILNLGCFYEPQSC